MKSVATSVAVTVAVALALCLLWGMIIVKAAKEALEQHDQ